MRVPGGPLDLSFRAPSAPSASSPQTFPSPSGPAPQVFAASQWSAATNAPVSQGSPAIVKTVQAVKGRKEKRGPRADREENAPFPQAPVFALPREVANVNTPPPRSARPYEPRPKALSLAQQPEGRFGPAAAQNFVSNMDDHERRALEDALRKSMESSRHGSPIRPPPPPSFFEQHKWTVGAVALTAMIFLVFMSPASGFSGEANKMMSQNAGSLYTSIELFTLDTVGRTCSALFAIMSFLGLMVNWVRGPFAMNTTIGRLPRASPGFGLTPRPSL